MNGYPITINAELVDADQTRRYLDGLFRYVDWQVDAGVVSMLGIGEKGTPKEGVFKERQFVAAGAVNAVVGHLKRWAQWHVAAFLVPAVLHASAQAAGDVTADKIAAMTALLVDLDSGDTEAALAYAAKRVGNRRWWWRPAGVTDSGQPKLHVYWRLTEPTAEVARVVGLRKLLAAKIGADQPTAGRATQVIRIPGLRPCQERQGGAVRADRRERDRLRPGRHRRRDRGDGANARPARTGNAVRAAGVVADDRRHDGLWRGRGPGRQPCAVGDAARRVGGWRRRTRWFNFTSIAGFNIQQIRLGHMTPDAALEATHGWMLAHMNPPWPQRAVPQ